MTQMQYLILTLTVYLGIILLIALATIAIQFLLRNSYFSFIILILLNMALFLGAYYSNVTFMNVILRLLNPTNLYITSGAWFMENDITLSFAGNEFWIIGVTGVWMILCVKIARNFKLYDRNVSSIHKNIKKDRCTKNEFHWRIFCKTLIRQHSCTTHCVQTVPVLAAILQKILWNSIISYLYLSLCFYEYLKTFSYKI